MEQTYRRLQRATVARSALDVIALIFLGCAFAFWGVAFWQLLGPPALLSLLSIQAVVLALVYSLATPLLWSMLVPTTPAGQLLQKTQWRTFGFAAIVGAAFFLSYQAEWMLEAWLYAQPAIRENNMARGLALSLAIAFILCPALAWVQLTPERWLQQIQQAHQVKKLEMQQRGELAIIKASLVRAETLAAVGWANLLPGERDEVLGTLRGLLMGSADSMRAVVKTLGLSADLERSIMNDDEIADQLDYVKNAIDVVPEVTPALPARSQPSVAQQSAETNGSRTIDRERERSATVPPRTANANANDTLDAARRALGANVWTRADLEEALSIQKTKAAEYIKAWRQSGDVVDISDPAYHYQFVGV
jgi:hypothetical protein